MDNINKIGKYIIESELGRGATVVAYKGIDPDGEEKVVRFMP